MAEGDKPSKSKLLAASLEAARSRDSSTGSVRPPRSSVAPPAPDRKSMPHRERSHGGVRESLSGDVRQGGPKSEPPRGYATEVRRANLLADDETDNFDPRAHFQLMMPAATPPANMRHATVNPGISERRDPGHSARSSPVFNSSKLPPRKSLSTLAALRSLLPGGRPAQEEDPRFATALDLRKEGRKLEAIYTLEELRRFTPEYPLVRETLFDIALELGAEDRVKPHADWVIQQQSQQQSHELVCASYRRLRNVCPNLKLAEKTLMAVLIASEKEEDARVTLDVTKLLLREFPSSPVLPRAFMASAHAQIAEGRADLARITLESLVARFPYDSLAGIARQKLNDVW